MRLQISVDNARHAVLSSGDLSVLGHGNSGMESVLPIGRRPPLSALALIRLATPKRRHHFSAWLHTAIRVTTGFYIDDKFLSYHDQHAYLASTAGSASNSCQNSFSAAQSRHNPCSARKLVYRELELENVSAL